MGGFLPCLTRGQSSVRMNNMVVSSSLRKEKGQTGPDHACWQYTPPPKKGWGFPGPPGNGTNRATNKQIILHKDDPMRMVAIKLLPTGFKYHVRSFKCVSTMCARLNSKFMVSSSPPTRGCYNRLRQTTGCQVTSVPPVAMLTSRSMHRGLE